MPPQSQNSDNERASRLRDNKRRHRARQKDYVQDLESKIAEYREQGVQATKEVQVAAQKVVRENARLKELLRRVGYSDGAIEKWVNYEESGEHAGPESSLTTTCATRDEFKSPSAQSISSCASNQLVGESQNSRNSCTQPSTEYSNRMEVGELVKNTIPVSRLAIVSPTPQESVKKCAGSCKSAGADIISSGPSLPPCKLLSLLAENPSADITQVSIPPGSVMMKDDDIKDGVECSKAYKMLIHYATSEEKMDDIAKALETGCTPMKGGGCKVKSSTILRTLDNINQ